MLPGKNLLLGSASGVHGRWSHPWAVANTGAILLVEDLADDVVIICTAFQRAGFHNRIVRLADGEAAIQYLKGEGEYGDRKRFPIPVLMLVDLKLPKVDGFEVLKWVRSRPEWCCLPVIVLTSSVYRADIERAYDLGANSFLTKPEDLTSFVREIKQVGPFWLQMSTLPATGPFIPAPDQSSAQLARKLSVLRSRAKSKKSTGAKQSSRKKPGNGKQKK
jgi:CheY-like chemotaxis protein